MLHKSLVSAWLTLPLGLLGCNDAKLAHDDQGPRYGVVEGAFYKAAAETGLPPRYLLAVGYLESRLAPENATANYLAVGKDQHATPRGTLLTQTAFGLSYLTLGLDPAKDESQRLETQVMAYAHWLSAQLKAAGVKMNPQPQTADEHFQWVENLSLLHRKGLTQRRNVQILFAKELLDVMNTGFIWQDPRNGERLELGKELTPISVNNLAPDGKQWFSQIALVDSPQQLAQAAYLPLVTVPSGEYSNTPKRIEVIHCPLTLSACLELQTRSQESDVRLAAHYVIPPIVGTDRQSDPLLNRVLQVANHRDALIVTNNKGENVPVTNAIVIMLVGNSGRMVGGSRIPAMPNWFTDLQLQKMGGLINDICTLLAQQDKSINRDTCMSTDPQQGVLFHHQTGSEEYRWGDIADFDPNIFEAYLRNPGGLGTEVAFKFEGGQRQFQASKGSPLHVLFDTSARQIVLERLNRCPDNRVVWEPLRNEQVRQERESTFMEFLHDSGPNHSGDQFFRVRVYGKDGHLMGWAIDRIYLSDFEPEVTFASDESCRKQI